MMTAVATANVPKITITVGRNIGQQSYAMVTDIILSKFKMYILRICMRGSSKSVNESPLGDVVRVQDVGHSYKLNTLLGWMC